MRAERQRGQAPLSPSPVLRTGEPVTREGITDHRLQFTEACGGEGGGLVERRPSATADGLPGSGWARPRSPRVRTGVAEPHVVPLQGQGEGPLDVDGHLVAGDGDGRTIGAVRVASHDAFAAEVFDVLEGPVVSQHVGEGGGDRAGGNVFITPYQGAGDEDGHLVAGDGEAGPVGPVGVARDHAVVHRVLDVLEGPVVGRHIAEGGGGRAGGHQ